MSDLVKEEGEQAMADQDWIAFSEENYDPSQLLKELLKGKPNVS